MDLMKKCEVCYKELSDPHSTHCSDVCLQKSIERSKKFDPDAVKKKKKN